MFDLLKSKVDTIGILYTISLFQIQIDSISGFLFFCGHFLFTFHSFIDFSL